MAKMGGDGGGAGVLVPQQILSRIGAPAITTQRRKETFFTSGLGDGPGAAPSRHQDAKIRTGRTRNLFSTTAAAGMNTAEILSEMVEATRSTREKKPSVPHAPVASSLGRDQPYQLPMFSHLNGGSSKPAARTATVNIFSSSHQKPQAQSTVNSPPANTGKAATPA